MLQFYLKFIVVFLLSYTATAQDNAHILFSYHIHKNIKSYIKEANAAYERGDDELGKKLFDSLIHNSLIGTKFDNFSFHRLNKKKLFLNTFKKPVYLLTYSSWCLTSTGEISALNKLAKKYGKDIQIVVVFWNRREEIKKIARKFNHPIEVCYAHETYNKDDYLVSTLKHTLGIPTTFLIDEGMNLIAIRRGGVNLGNKMPYDQSFSLNYERFYDGISPLISNEDRVKNSGGISK